MEFSRTFPEKIFRAHWLFAVAVEQHGTFPCSQFSLAVVACAGASLGVGGKSGQLGALKPVVFCFLAGTEHGLAFHPLHPVSSGSFNRRLCRMSIRGTMGFASRASSHRHMCASVYTLNFSNYSATKYFSKQTGED